MMLRYVNGPVRQVAWLIRHASLQTHEPEPTRSEDREGGPGCKQRFHPCGHWRTDGVDSQTIAEGKTITGDLGGRATTKQYTAAIINKLTGA
ncbi:hypothetical protein J3R82DRAFT_4533 [Butyriboletus roseoflavus]|nr:hypothetical protein J3R82DRAFT_4533 [Butyriboletus roseoflavus]